MNITFLGTGTSQGIPVIACHCPVCSSTDPKDQRLRSSAAIDVGCKRLIIDCGPDFRQQMLRANYDSIDAILLTHSHKDHMGGLDDVRAYNYFLQKPTEIYGSGEVLSSIKKEFSYAFGSDRYPGVPDIHLNRIVNKKFEVDGISVLPIEANHYSDQKVFGYRIGDLTYLTDAIEISPEEMDKIRGSRIIVINSLRKKKHYSHFNLEQAVEIIKELHPDQGYLTHISHQMGLHEDVERELPEYIHLAFDGLSIGD